MSKYALTERERRFLLDRLPNALGPGYAIEDRYLQDVRLRLRRMEGPEGVRFKLTQKVPRGPSEHLLTTIYLDEVEYERLRALPGHDLRKVRHRLRHGSVLWSIDVFGAPCDGLVLAETELTGPEGLELPTFLGREVTADPAFEGGNLARNGGGNLARNGWSGGEG